MELVTTTTGSCSSLSSMSSSSSSSLNLSMLEDESNMKSTTIVSASHSHTPTKKRCQQGEERFFFVKESDEGDEHYFFEACFLCKKPISNDHEIFMYRGDKAFCSDKCRTEQMEMDEALETVERRQNLKTKSAVSYSTSNYVGRNSSEEKQEEKSIFSIHKRPTVINLTACGLLNLQNFGFSTHVAFMEP